MKNNLCEKALEFIEKIPFKPNDVIYAIVYNACASLLNEKAVSVGNRIFQQMPKAFLNDIVLMNSAIHMFMRFGQIEDGEQLFEQMKHPSSHTYAIMLSGYNINEEPQKCLSFFEEMKKTNVPLSIPIALSLVGACAQIGLRSVSQGIGCQIGHLQDDLRLKTSLIDMWVCSFTIRRFS